MTAAIRLTSPADIVAAVPHLCGFVPTDSLVAIALQGKRIALTMRFDLAAEGLAEELVRRVRHVDATSTVLVLYSSSGDWEPLVAGLRTRLDVVEALHVRDERWTSFLCSSASCCPPTGTPVVGSDLLAAVSAYEGRAVLRDRAELVRSLATPTQPLALDAPPASLAEFRDQLGVPVGPCAAALVVALQDRRVRDEVALLALDHDEALLALLLELARRCSAPSDVPVCTLIALVAWLRGDGALANVALDRALAGEPGCTMALLMRAGLDAQLPPSAVRSWLRATRRAIA
jgi:hypothetical protein